MMRMMRAMRARARAGRPAEIAVRGAEGAAEIVFRKEIDEQAKRQGIEIRQGDVVLFHTGWLSLVGKDDKRYLAGEPGLGREGAA